MNRLDKVLNNKEKAIQERAVAGKRNKPKDKPSVIPTYDVRGRTITPEKKRRDRRLLITGIVIAALAAFLYIPQFFLPDKDETTYTVATPDGEAIKTNNAILRTYTEGDFDQDGISNADEEMSETNPWNPDTDGDGAFDFYEINVSKTDPTTYDEDILVDMRTKLDEMNNESVNSPYKIGNVILWAENYHSKAHGAVVETTRGYRFSDFLGFAQFPSEDGQYSYKIEDGIRTLLPYREAENAWRIEPYTTVEIYDNPLEEIVELNVFSKTFYFSKSKVWEIVAKILPEKGFINASEKMRIDVEPESTQDVTTAIVKPSYDTDDDYRFTINTNHLTDLLSVRKTIAESDACVAVSMYNASYGEYIAIVYGYTPEGDLLIADADTLEPTGIIKIEETARNIIDQNGDMLTMSYFKWSGKGFNSENGDRICFFAASSGINTFSKTITTQMEVANDGADIEVEPEETKKGPIEQEETTTDSEEENTEETKEQSQSDNKEEEKAENEQSENEKDADREITSSSEEKPENTTENSNSSSSSESNEK